MAELVKITKNQPFALYVPLVILNADGSKERVDALSISNTVVTYKCACSEQTEITPSAHDHFLVLSFGKELPVGIYEIEVTATLQSGREFALRIKRAFGIVDWDDQSNWRDYLVGDHIELTDQPFIAGPYVTDTDLQNLKEQLMQKIAETEQAKEAYEQAKADYDAKAEALDDVAKQSTLTQGVQDIREDISHIDFSAIAKQGSNATVSLTSIDGKITDAFAIPFATKAQVYAMDEEILTPYENE